LDSNVLTVVGEVELEKGVNEIHNFDLANVPSPRDATEE